MEQQRGEARVFPLRAQRRDQHEEPPAQRAPGVAARQLHLGLGVRHEPAASLGGRGGRDLNNQKQQELENATFGISNTQALPVGVAAGPQLGSAPAPALAGTALPCGPNTLGVSRYTL